MQCCVSQLKCCTDRVICAINCICIPLSAAFIACKGYAFSFTKNISWGHTVLPALILVFVNILYFVGCCIVKKSLEHKPLYSSKADTQLP